MVARKETVAITTTVLLADKAIWTLPHWVKFWTQIKVDKSGCWIWTGGKSGTYGMFHDAQRLPRRTHMVHRISYMNLIGPIPEEMTIDHLCRVRLCINPLHLEVVTRGENVLRGVGTSAQNARKTHCDNGHAFDEENTHIRKEGHRECRACARNRARIYRAQGK